VYVARHVQGPRRGGQLLRALIDGARAAGIWMIQTSIFPENRTSLALHERCGFRVVGVRERIAKRDGIWRDTIFLEKRL
jgi:L-amino acid N-acyltransferase YncA